MHNMLFVQYDSPATLIPDVNTELYLIMQDRPSYSLEFTVSSNIMFFFQSNKLGQLYVEWYFET